MITTRWVRTLGQIVVLGFSSDGISSPRDGFPDFRINISIRDQQWLGADLGRPIVEISWFEIAPETSSPAIAKAAVCSALTAALELGGSAPHIVGMEAINERMTLRLRRRPEFIEHTSSPFPFLADDSEIRVLAARVCPRATE